MHTSFVSTEVISEPVSEIWQYGDALNIEGGLIPQRHLRKDQIWANLCFILDRPFYDGVELKDITRKNSYPLKEANIMDYNERRAALATAITLKYYITQTHTLKSLSDMDQSHIIVQVHRNSTGPAHLRFLKNLIELMEFNFVDGGVTDKGAQLLIFPQYKVVMELRHGVIPTTYEDADVVLSIGVAAGIHPSWKSGTVMVPHRFIPFDIHNMALMLPLTYEVKNHLSTVLDNVINLQDHELLYAINTHYASKNSTKSQEYTGALIKEDFRPARILQVNGLFNPSKIPKSLAVFRKEGKDEN